MKVIVASANPAKIAAVHSALSLVWPDKQINCTGVSTVSGVAAQPMNSEETLQGALNRLHAISDAQQHAHYHADYYVAIEAGLDGDCSFAWVAISNNDRISKTRSASLPIPPAALYAIQQGEELGDVMDRMFNQHNVKQQGGAIAMLTNHLLTRSGVYQQAIILAMIPFIQPQLFNV
ncbi:inosine/xanthosine triphosphatase [Rheinheimera baltica]|uniref:Inosine/xanthosine triphosphatase n=1 Tax=Rheinheimera baltica TaxID=67576 RepID=A0ABT9HTB3_9GAMM|nr:inosine/xanthosine triphosphatase [Rheinheimera baltica]MDP5134369.1 inosine/xanthosine triphosphatase [Rheinheimera baltica]MDP5141198.1 inosine/xanthosine triphosphatase [Rheinheimera baltica]MDP5148429.1 inosine/xanthosine triphosphatase [Rheinheimera baltica]